MSVERLVRIGIWLVLGAISVVWLRYRKRKRLGKLVMVGRLIGVNAPYRAIFGIANYILSNFTMILVSQDEGDHLLAFAFAFNLIFSSFFQIRDFRSIWNRVFVYEKGIEINYVEIPRRRILSMLRDASGQYTCVRRFGGPIKYAASEESDGAAVTLQP